MNEAITLNREKRMPPSGKATLTAVLLGFAMVVAIIVWLGHRLGHERIASFRIGSHRTINVYAEGEFHYEPPGYISFEIIDAVQVGTPERRFMGIGPERKPSQEFRLVTTSDEGTVALVLDKEIQMIHEFSSGYTWPGPYTNVTEAQWQMAEILLEHLRRGHPELRCTRQEWYRQALDREQKK